MTLPDIFCRIVAGHAPATVIRRWYNADAIVAVPQCTPGHLLVISHEHAESAGANPTLGGLTMQYAAELAASDIDWPGRDGATDFFLCHNVGGDNGGDQTVFHPHAHVIPRRPGDGLLMPWSVQHGRARVEYRLVYGDGRPVVMSDTFDANESAQFLGKARSLGFPDARIQTRIVTDWTDTEEKP